MKCNQPIAILMATYNGDAYLGQQIDSILVQTFTRWHLYVHDDGSTDETPALLAQYERLHPEQITVLHYEKQGGACRNFISMLLAVDAPYYMFSDQDDVWLPEKVEATFNAMRRIERDNGGVPVLVHTDLSIVDSELQMTAPSFMRNQQIHLERIKTFADYASTNTVTGCTAMLNRQARQCMRQPYDKALMHDSWLCLSVVASEGIVSYLDFPLVLYRQHGSNALGAFDLNKMTLLYKLRSLPTLIRANRAHYREMNAVKPLSVLDFIKAKIRYRR